MDSLSHLPFASYWTTSQLCVNVLVILNLLGALVLGTVIGYERSFRGRAAGMRTYGLVCMASAALTCVVGYPLSWYGGGHIVSGSGDPTRVIQGIVTGIGFLGAGVIMKDGLNISGLTTAASIWACSATGILVGVGFYSAAIALTIAATLSMILVSQLEAWLPSHPAIDVVLTFRQGATPSETALRETARLHDYDIAASSLSVRYTNGQPEWHFVAISRRGRQGESLVQLADDLSMIEGVADFSMSPTRN
jgi:putative Mg2+ transporter-C (MgtC) family protein